MPLLIIKQIFKKQICDQISFKFLKLMSVLKKLRTKLKWTFFCSQTTPTKKWRENNKSTFEHSFIGIRLVSSYFSSVLLPSCQLIQHTEQITNSSYA